MWWSPRWPPHRHYHVWLGEVGGNGGARNGMMMISSVAGGGGLADVYVTAPSGARLRRLPL